MPGKVAVSLTRKEISALLLAISELHESLESSDPRVSMALTRAEKKLREGFGVSA